ncbi:MAG: hypothetical protein HY900_01140 [Deltaproteobacteria bacterium]|nr:hypothetical protein [Deltaproteobacteria bacterium]
MKILLALLLCLHLGAAPLLAEAFGVETGACAAGCPDGEDEGFSPVDQCGPCLCCPAGAVLPSFFPAVTVAERSAPFAVPAPRLLQLFSAPDVFHPPRAA